VEPTYLKLDWPGIEKRLTQRNTTTVINGHGANPMT